LQAAVFGLPATVVYFYSFIRFISKIYSMLIERQLKDDSMCTVQLVAEKNAAIQGTLYTEGFQIKNPVFIHQPIQHVWFLRKRATVLICHSLC
jgi:hypothetical protein